MKESIHVIEAFEKLLLKVEVKDIDTETLKKVIERIENKYSK